MHTKSNSGVILYRRADIFNQNTITVCIIKLISIPSCAPKQL